MSVVRILREEASCWTMEPATELAVLIDGESYYSSFYEAALQAEHSILLSGWQFDSKVALLRGEAAARAPAPVTLLAFLEELCRRKPALRIYVLAWDYSVVFALEREWLQKVAFDWMTHERLHFAFDRCIPLEGSHHQKFVVIDGVLAFVGGADICEHRWDERSHALDNPLRFVATGELYPPYHEVHSYLRGPAVRRLVDFFADRWNDASTTELVLGPEAPGAITLSRHDVIRLPADRVALCRTAVTRPDHPCHDIRTMMVEAFAAAEELVYVETQYLTSHAVVDAILTRLRDDSRPKLDMVFVLPVEPEAPKEGLAMGVLQARAVKRIQKVARAHGQQVGFYTSVATDPTGREVATYIHSKLIAVDDRFLSFGSANLSNRSMGVDTELNIGVECDDPRMRLGRAIRRLRVSLLAEHLGVGNASARMLVPRRGLVARLDALADAGSTRLRRYVAVDPSVDAPLVGALHASVGKYLDPEEPTLRTDLEEPERWIDIFARGISALRAHLDSSPESDEPASLNRTRGRFRPHRRM